MPTRNLGIILKYSSFLLSVFSPEDGYISYGPIQPNTNGDKILATMEIMNWDNADVVSVFIEAIV